MIQVEKKNMHNDNKTGILNVVKFVMINKYARFRTNDMHLNYVQ